MLSFTDLYLMEMARMPHKMGEDDQKYMDSTKEDIAAKAKKCRSTNTPFVVTLKPGFPTKQAKARIKDIVREAAIKIRENGLPQHYVLKNEGNNTAILIDGDRDNYRTVSAPIAHEFITKGAQCPGAIKYTGNPSDVQLLKQVTGKDVDSGNAPSIPTAPPSPVIPPPSAPVTPAPTAAPTVKRRGRPPKRITPIVKTVAKQDLFNNIVQNYSMAYDDAEHTEIKFILTKQDEQDIYEVEDTITPRDIQDFYNNIYEKFRKTGASVLSIVKESVGKKFSLFIPNKKETNVSLQFLQSVFPIQHSAGNRVKILWKEHNQKELAKISSSKTADVVIIDNANATFSQMFDVANDDYSTSTTDNYDDVGILDGIINNVKLNSRNDEVIISFPLNAQDKVLVDDWNKFLDWMYSLDKKYPSMRYLSIIKPVGNSGSQKFTIYTKREGNSPFMQRISRFLMSLINVISGRGRAKFFTIEWNAPADKNFEYWEELDNPIVARSTDTSADPAIMFGHFNTVHGNNNVSNRNTIDDTTGAGLGTNSPNDAITTNSLDYGNQLASIHQTYSYNDNSKELSFFIPLPEPGVTVDIRQVQNVHDNIVAVTKEKLPMFVSLVDAAAGTKTVILYGRLDDGMLAGSRIRDFYTIISYILKPMPPRSKNVVMAFDIVPDKIRKKYGDRIAENVSMNANPRDLFDDKYFVGSRFEAPSSSTTSTNLGIVNTGVSSSVEQQNRIQKDLAYLVSASQPKKGSAKSEFIITIDDNLAPVMEIDEEIFRNFKQSLVKKIVAWRPDYISIVKTINNVNEKFILKLVGGNYSNKIAVIDEIYEFFDAVIHEENIFNSKKVRVMWKVSDPGKINSMRGKVIMTRDIRADAKKEFEKIDGVSTSNTITQTDNLKKAAMDVLSAMATKPADTSVFNAPSASDLPTSNVAASLPPIPADVQLTIGKDEINKYIEMGKNNKVKRFVPKEMYGRIEGMQKLPGGSIRDCIKSIGSLFGGMDDTFLSLMKYYIDCYEATKDEKYAGAVAELVKQYGFNETQFNRLHDGIRQLQEIETFLRAIDYSFKSSII